MPFGLTNAPVVFQAMVNDILRDMHNQFVFVYLDDILILFLDEERPCHPCEICSLLFLDNKLFVKVEKCEFHNGQSEKKDLDLETVNPILLLTGVFFSLQI